MACNTKDDNWIQTDEAEDVAASVRHARRCLALTIHDEQAWKWFCLALHSALQGACVCHLVTTASPVGAVTTKNAVKWLAFFEESRGNARVDPPATYLMSLPDLLQSIRKPNSAGDRSNESGVLLTDHEFDWLKRFHQGVRNEFVHFVPQGWSIDVSGLPDLAKLITRVIQEILAIGWAFRHKNQDWKTALQEDLERLAKSE